MTIDNYRIGPIGLFENPDQLFEKRKSIGKSIPPKDSDETAIKATEPELVAESEDLSSMLKRHAGSDKQPNRGKGRGRFPRKRGYDRGYGSYSLRSGSGGYGPNSYYNGFY